MPDENILVTRSLERAAEATIDALAEIKRRNLEDARALLAEAVQSIEVAEKRMAGGVT